ncbi:hypothetical protein H1P_640025 [Hyella patelloides LEGE 07179]|uniref:Uncharacterized protein n=1 Tax=Hyella patelloides LEGE 07179 TaxID=945734 RepID=A0A563W253_9CYAN|nr:hypothetical protein H1P_640025 [Hyella patelloides LEGE 07179]
MRLGLIVVVVLILINGYFNVDESSKRSQYDEI